MLNPSIRLSATGPLEPDAAWRRYNEPARWPSWAPQVLRVESDGDRLVAGLRGRVVGPLGVSVDFTVLSVDDAARRWSWQVRRWPVTLVLEHSVEPHGTGTRAGLTLKGPLPVLAGYAPVAWYALHRLVLPEDL